MSSVGMAFPFFIFIKLLFLLSFSKAEPGTSSPVISNSVANHICRQQNGFQETSQIQPPQKNRPQDDDSDCGWYSWEKCDNSTESDNEPCPSFVLKTCDAPEPAKKKGKGITTLQQGPQYPCDNSTEKGLPDPIEIVSKMSKYPWVVTIGRGDRCTIKYCTGLILDQNWIIVPVLGCFWLYQPEHSDYYEIVAGQRRFYNEEGTEQRRSVVEFVQHPGFFKEESKYYIDNIGLVRVSSPFEFNENVQPIELSAIEAIAPSIPNSTLKIVGWLYTQPQKENEELLASLIEASLDFVPMDECYDQRMEKDKTPRDILVCAGKCVIFGDENKQPLRNILFAQETPESAPVPIGLGPLKHSAGAPQHGVFVNLVSYIPWIKETAQGQGPGQGQTTESPETGSRIIRGEEAPPHKYKSMVNLEPYQSYACTSHACGGTIISEEWIVTAAHCVTNWPQKNMRIVAGDHDISDSDENEQVVNVSKVIVHENYESAEYFNDIAVVKVTPAFKFNDVVQKATLPDPNFEPEPSGPLKAIGWGIDENFIFPHILRQVELPYVPLDECNRYHFDRKTPFNESHICAGIDKGACFGDSGSPLYHFDKSGEQIFVGVTSLRGSKDVCSLSRKLRDETDPTRVLGTGELEPEVELAATEKPKDYRPTIYTRVSAFLEWIRKNAEMGN